MVQRGQHVRFTPEACDSNSVVRHFRREHLDRDLAVQRRVACTVDLAHGSGAERSGDGVVRERLTWEHGFLAAGFGGVEEAIVAAEKRRRRGRPRWSIATNVS
jgi:hypothetical protein